MCSDYDQWRTKCQEDFERENENLIDDFGNDDEFPDFGECEPEPVNITREELLEQLSNYDMFRR